MFTGSSWKLMVLERPLTEVLEEISEKFQVFFTYDAELLKDIQVDFDLSEAQHLEEAVNALLETTGLAYEHLGDRYYVIYKDNKRGKKTMKKMKRKLQQIQKLEQSGSLSLQKHSKNQPVKDLNNISQTIKKLNAANKLHGMVTDEEGQPLIGANIVIKDTRMGTITDIDGEYTLDVPASSNVLIFSYTGYTPLEVEINKQNTIDAVLEVSTTQLAEVVVTGYGRQQRNAVTGAVSSIDLQQISSLPLTSVEQSMQGRVAGLQVIQTSGGMPGGAVQVNIRGIGTINGETPLYVIDGIPVQEGGQNDRGYSFLNHLNPHDIESIDILKDASAAAIYGSRASGGVILITTKRGKEGPVEVSFDTYYGNQFRGALYDLLNASQYAEYLRELHSQPDGQPPTAFANGQTPRNVDTDWQKALFQATAPIQNHSLSISGGSEHGTFSLGFEYFDQEGVMLGSSFDRYALRANSDFKIGKRIKVGETLLMSRTNRGSINHSAGRRAQEHAIKQSPFVQVYDESFLGGFGHPAPAEGQDARNPVADQYLSDHEQERYRLWAAIYGEAELFRGLTYKLQLGLDFGYQNHLKYNPEFESVRRLLEASYIERKRIHQFNPLLDHYLTFEQSFGKHDVSLMSGFSAQSFQYTEVGGHAEGLPTGVVSLSAASANINAFDAKIESGLRSLFARLTYNFDHKYLLTANIRRDETSKLYRAQKTGLFPSASIGWIISEEPFLQNHPVISNLKFRAAYGEVGNQTPLSAYPTDINLRTDYFYVLGNQTVQGIQQDNLASRNITWEISKQIDIGLDAGLWHNRLTLQFDYYKRNTEDLIWLQDVPPSVGLGPAFVNAGEIKNEGVELALTYHKSSGNFTFNLGGNLTTINNRVVSLVNNNLIIKTGNPSDDLRGVSWTMVGGAIGTFYGYVNDGIFRNWDEVYEHAYINQATTGEMGDNGAPIYATDQRDAITATQYTAPGDVRWRDVNGDGIVDADDQVALGSPIPKLIYGFNFSAAFKGIDFQVFLQGTYGNKVYNAATRWLSDNRQNFNVGTQALNATSYRENYTASEPRLVRADPNKNILRSSDRYVFDGSYARIKNLTIGYTFGQHIHQAINAKHIRIYATAQNLALFTSYSGLEPEVGSVESGTGLDAGIDRLIYPQPTSVVFGAQLRF